MGAVVIRGVLLDSSVTGSLVTVVFTFTNQNPINSKSQYVIEFLAPALFASANDSGGSASNTLKVVVNGARDVTQASTATYASQGDGATYLARLAVGNLCSESVDTSGVSASPSTSECATRRDYSITISGLNNCAVVVQGDRSV